MSTSPLRSPSPFQSSSSDGPVTANQFNQMAHMVQQMMNHQTQQIQQQSQQMQQIISALPLRSSAVPATAASAQSSNPIFSSGPSTSSNALPQKVKISAPSNFSGTRDINVDSWLFETVNFLFRGKNDSSLQSTELRRLCAAFPS